MTRMTHPDTTLTVDATPANEAMYASQGWRPKASRTTPPSGDAAPDPKE